MRLAKAAKLYSGYGIREPLETASIKRRGSFGVALKTRLALARGR